MLAFALGMAAIISPCVLPVIPLVFAASRGNVVNVVLIFLGMLLNMAVIGFAASAFLELKYAAYAFMTFFAIALLSERVEEKLSSAASILASRFSAVNRAPSFIFGFFLAFVWLPCIAPFMGVAVSQAMLTPHKAMPIMLSYGFGMLASISIILIAGKRLVSKLSVRSKYLNKFAGVAVIVYVIYFALT